MKIIIVTILLIIYWLITAILCLSMIGIFFLSISDEEEKWFSLGEKIGDSLVKLLEIN